MKNRKIWLGTLAITLVFGMMFVGCGDGGEEKKEPPPYVPPAPDPLTGTVSINSNITISYGMEEKMTLTADVSNLNGDSYYHFYQWKRNNVNINGASSSTYTVTSDDYGKAISVHVTNSVFSGEKSGEFDVPSPTILNLTLKWAIDAGKKDTGVEIVRENGGYWKSTSGNLTTTGTTITLTSWNQTKFKMRTTYKFTVTEFYFKKDNATGSELFNLTNGSKTYVLTNINNSDLYLSDLYATEE